MGRPWWYDSYWEKGKKPQRKSNLPRRQTLVWIGLVVLSLLLGATMTGFQPSVIVWLIGFVYYFCRILSYVVFVRVLLSWFNVRRQNIFIVLLDDITEPILSPLRRVVPRLGVFDITPLIAMGILYIIPIIITRLLG
ncbi:YggT family protein, partial [Chloroflexota bacterium]